MSPLILLKVARCYRREIEEKKSDHRTPVRVPQEQTLDSSSSRSAARHQKESSKAFPLTDADLPPLPKRPGGLGLPGESLGASALVAGLVQTARAGPADVAVAGGVVDGWARGGSLRGRVRGGGPGGSGRGKRRGVGAHAVGEVWPGEGRE
jgi:hypothetical protein